MKSDTSSTCRRSAPLALASLSLRFRLQSAQYPRLRVLAKRSAKCLTQYFSNILDFKDPSKSSKRRECHVQGGIQMGNRLFITSQVFCNEYGKASAHPSSSSCCSMDPVAPTVIPSDSIISISVIAFLQKVRKSLANDFLSSGMVTFTSFCFSNVTM